jgi:hypothetical protein
MLCCGLFLVTKRPARDADIQVNSSAETAINLAKHMLLRATKTVVKDEANFDLDTHMTDKGRV